MKKIFFTLMTLGFITGIIFLSACEKLLDYEIPDIEERIVMHGILKPDSAIMIKLSHSTSIKNKIEYDSDELKLDDKATVKVFENGELFEVLHQESTPGVFGGTKTVSYGNDYKIEVSHPDYETATSEARIPKASEIIAIDTVTEFINEGSDSWREKLFTLKIKDIADQKNYYSISSFVTYQNDIPGYPENGYIYSYQPELDARMVKGSVVFSDAIFDGKEFDVKVSSPFYFYYEGNDVGSEDFNASVTFILSSISEDYYKYLLSSASYRDGDFGSDMRIFSEATQIYTNVNNGLGIVGAINFSTINFEL